MLLGDAVQSAATEHDLGGDYRHHFVVGKRLGDAVLAVGVPRVLEGRHHDAAVAQVDVNVGRGQALALGTFARLRPLDLETLADQIAEICLSDPRALSCRIRIEKLDRYPDAVGIGIEVEHRRGA